MLKAIAVTISGGGGSGTVTNVSGTDANGIAFSISNPTTTPNIIISLGAITPISVNGLTLAAQAIGFTIAGGTSSKTLTVPSDANVSNTNTGDQNLFSKIAVSGQSDINATSTTSTLNFASGSNVTVTTNGTTNTVTISSTGSGGSIPQANFNTIS